jgi:transposase-like protein
MRAPFLHLCDDDSTVDATGSRRQPARRGYDAEHDGRTVPKRHPIGMTRLEPALGVPRLLNLWPQGSNPFGEGVGEAPASPRKKVQDQPVAAPAETRHPGGRPGRLTPELADAIVAQLDAGAGPAEAARACGVGERTLRTWRRRAWSARKNDAPYVDLEKRIQHVLRKGAPAEAPATDWEEAAAFLEHERPERWAALPEVEDLLGELDSAVTNR